MIYTKKHVKAVHERLMVYEFSIVSGKTIWSDKCNLCASVSFFQHCGGCILGTMKQGFVGFRCMSKTRRDLHCNMLLDLPMTRLLKERYDELIDHIGTWHIDD